MKQDQYNRQRRFIRWWLKNKTHRPSHHWLVKHSKRIIYDYNTAPDQWDKAKQVIRRYTNSDYKKLSRSDAWFLWRLVFPLHTARIERLLATAVFLDEKRSQASR